jgi:hypothetical protein
MPERSSVAQVSQIGVEATPGTAVAATRRLGSINLTPSISAENEPFRPEGLKFPTVMVPNKEWATVDVGGVPTYEEVVVPLSGAADVATIAQVLDGATPTGAYEWTFVPETAVPDAPKTFTLERGQDGVQVEKFSHLLFTGFSLEFSRGGVTLGGSAFAKAADATGTALTGGIQTPAELTPIASGHFSVYMADTYAALETAGASDPAKRLGRVISGNPSIEDRYNPAWFVNQAEQSFTTWVENPDGVGGSFELLQEANPAGEALLATMRGAASKFVRVEAFGPVIYNAGAKPNLRMMFQWDMCVKVSSPGAWSDEDGVYALPFTLQPTHDSTWGKAMQIKVRNKVSAL